MKNERILSYKMAEKLTVDDLLTVSAAGGMTNTWTAQGTRTPSGWDGTVDVTWDA